MKARKIHTSYFAAARRLDPELFEPISIARFQPEGCGYPEFRNLAPARPLLDDWRAGGLDEAGFERRYHKEVLDGLSPHVVAALLRGICEGGREPVLLCWEGPGKFCHRRLAARWLRSAGIAAGEIDMGEEQGKLW
ncbi:MAG: DUF488 family protein [Nitrososphaerota archaeon]|nr:DUF488 family protein [Nitrososphaerota archaeon]